MMRGGRTDYHDETGTYGSYFYSWWLIFGQGSVKLFEMVPLNFMISAEQR